MTESYVPAFVVNYIESATQDPTNPLSLYARASDCRARGDMSEWHRLITEAMALPHDTPEQQCLRAYAQLLRGDWSGWTDYEARKLHADDCSPRTTVEDWIRWTHREWDGAEDLTDKTLLVLFEQGMGDNIQMLRFIPFLADRAKSIIVRVYPRLVPLVQCNFGDRVAVLIQGVDKPFTFDRYANTMSLPHLTGTLPPFVPLRGPGRRSPLPARRRPIRGGLCWAGNPDYGNDEQRSMPGTHMAGLLDRQDIEWYSLQVGKRAGDADQFTSLLRPWPPLVNFAETADFIAELDVVIAVDTAVGHLAGCLGVPTYLMLPFVGEFRWGLGTRTPWYPSMQLVRQMAPGDWGSVISRVHTLLDEFTARQASIANNGHEIPSRVLSATH